MHEHATAIAKPLSGEHLAEAGIPRSARFLYIRVIIWGRDTPSRAARSDPSAGGARAPHMTPGEFMTPEAYNDA